MSEEHYRALGISPDAEKAEIRAAYKQRVKETHPDLNDDPNAAAEFQRVKAARDALLGSGATGATASGGSGRSGPGSSGRSSASGTDGTGTSSSGSASSRSSSSGGRTETSGSSADSRERRNDTDADGSDPRANYSTRTEEPTGEHAEQYGGATSSSDRTSSGPSSTESGTDDRARTNRSETAGSSRRQRETGGAAGTRTSAGSTDRQQETGAGAGGTQDYVRFRSVIEEPTGSRAASYDRVVTSTHTPARTGTTETGTGGDASVLMLLPAFLVILTKQYIYSLKWALLGLPLTGLYLVGIRGLYFAGFQTSALSMVLGAVGVSLVKARLGVNFSGTATLALSYYVFIWYPSQPYGPLSWLEVGIAVHLLPLFVMTALIAEYK